MKKILFILSLCSLALCNAAMANPINTITVINHFSTPLEFTVDRNNEVVPEFANHFTVAPGGQASSTVVPAAPEVNRAYIITRGGEDAVAFWSVETKGIYGHMAKDLSFSWSTRGDGVVTFCSPEDFKKLNHC